MVTGKALINSAKIAKAAIEASDCEDKRKFLRGKLEAAYYRFKMLNGIERIERDTRDWERMMAATKREYEAVEDAKREERNARRRLKSAVGRFKYDVYQNLTSGRAA